MTYGLLDAEIIKRLPYFGRLLDEYFELNEKVEKLVKFKTTQTFNSLSNEEKKLLTEQLNLESNLLDVLNKRIIYIRENK